MCKLALHSLALRARAVGGDEHIYHICDTRAQAYKHTHAQSALANERIDNFSSIYVVKNLGSGFAC